MLPGLAAGRSVQTELGRLDLAAPASGPVHVARAPGAAASCAPATTPNAEVVDREFRGHDVLYRLRHEGGRMLLVQLPSLELFEVGAQVHVGPAPATVAPVVDIGSAP